MKALYCLGILLGLIFLANGLKQVLDSGKDICRLFPDGAILRKPGSCKELIKCQNGLSTPHSIKCKDNQIVGLDKMTCVTKKDAYCVQSCPKNSRKWIADKKNCNEWIACEKTTVINSGSCPQGQVFDEKQQICDYRPSEFKCERIFEVCNLAKVGQKFWDEGNCHKYFVCEKGSKTSNKQCPISTYYDVRSGLCTKKSQVNCYKHPVPIEACGNKKLAIHDRFISDQATCRGYFYCRNLNQNGTQIPDENPPWGQCPVGNFFDNSLQACRQQNHIKCIEDRCDGKAVGKALSEMPGCQHYLVCQNGMTTEEIKCEDNKYFDPITEKCVDTKISYPICSM